MLSGVNITGEICSGPEATSATSPTTAARERNPSGEISRSRNVNIFSKCVFRELHK